MKQHTYLTNKVDRKKKDWKKISKGAYGTVYSCTTDLYEPKEVAIKQMIFPKTIYERCVLHDIFTERFLQICN